MWGFQDKKGNYSYVFSSSKPGCLHRSLSDHSEEHISNCQGMHTMRFSTLPSQGPVLSWYMCHFLLEFLNLFTKKLSYVARLLLMLGSDFADHRDNLYSPGWWHGKGSSPAAANFHEAGYRRPHSVSFGGEWNPASESPSSDDSQHGCTSPTSACLMKWQFLPSGHLQNLQITLMKCLTKDLGYSRCSVNITSLVSSSSCPRSELCICNKHKKQKHNGRRKALEGLCTVLRLFWKIHLNPPCSDVSPSVFFNLRLYEDDRWIW